MKLALEQVYKSPSLEKTSVWGFPKEKGEGTRSESLSQTPSQSDFLNVTESDNCSRSCSSKIAIQQKVREYCCTIIYRQHSTAEMYLVREAYSNGTSLHLSATRESEESYESSSSRNPRPPQTHQVSFQRVGHCQWP